MKALSIRQPWAWAICHAGKRVENREWLSSSPSLHVARRLVGQTIAIHASAGSTYREHVDAAAWMVERGLVNAGTGIEVDLAAAARGAPTIPTWRALPRGVLVARARIADVVQTTPEGHRYRPIMNHTCTLCGEHGVLRRVPPPACPKADPWAIPGCVGLILADVEPLPAPAPFRGALGFFEVPDELLLATGGAS